MGRKVSFVAILVVFVSVLLIIALFGTDTLTFSENSNSGIPDSVLFTTAPVLSPEEALSTFELEEGFSIELVASEPMIQDPVALDIDEKGRLWVVEMQSFMPDIGGIGEDSPSARIVILEDLDGDLKMDTSKVFLDKLVMPRAVCVVANGILYSEPPNLWFVENKNDKPGARILIDSAYAVGGNVEHQPNGLMRGIDNWIYNAKSRSRYKYSEGVWIKEETEFRGQWGISKDNYGRLIYNTNSNQLRGDLIPPNMHHRNPNLSSSEGINRELVSDQRVYPIRPTPGINRGYQDQMLDEESRLKTFTAACAPVIYRGDQFPEEYLENAFVSEPAGNLVKRNILKKEGVYLNGTQAYQQKEFLASKDERFRPVNIYNAPDGSLYLVDMYRGIIQHETYLTDYLRDQIRSRGLQKPLGLGRIYRIVYKGNWWEQLQNRENKYKPPRLDQLSDKELVPFLAHTNGWWRDIAQRLLVERNNWDVIPDISRLLKEDNHLAQIHALWTLEGIGIHDPSTVQAAFESTHPEVVATAIRVCDRNANNKYAEATLSKYETFLDNTNPHIQLQLALSLGEFISKGSGRAMLLLSLLIQNTPEDPVMMEAILSSVSGKEKELLNQVTEAKPGKEKLIAYLKNHIERIILGEALKDRDLGGRDKEMFFSGKPLYDLTCAPCHGLNGEGVVPIAPPLNNSEWVTGDPLTLIRISLFGMDGPVTVQGKVYKEPEIQPFMPGLIENTDYTDEKIAAILTYVRNAWQNRGSPVTEDQVKKVRENEKGRAKPLNEKELLQQ